MWWKPKAVTITPYQNCSRKWNYHKLHVRTSLYVFNVRCGRCDHSVVTYMFSFTVEKESKILSGKSLMTISRLVPEGLTLAVHLDLPDSTITGLGFDAISNGLGMVDVTYKILLYWKRQQKDKKDGAVEILSLALRDMGRDDVAAMALQKHKENKDLTLDCFMQTWWRNINL